MSQRLSAWLMKPVNEDENSKIEQQLLAPPVTLRLGIILQSEGGHCFQIGVDNLDLCILFRENNMI